MTDQIDLAEINSAQDCIAAAADPETVSHVEEVVLNWCKKISQVFRLIYACFVGDTPLMWSNFLLSEQKFAHKIPNIKSTTQNPLVHTNMLS